MASYTNSPFLKMDPLRPAPEGFEGEGAGGRGTMGRSNQGEDHRQPPDMKGTFGPSVENGLPSAEYRRLNAKSTGVDVSDGRNPSPYGKKATY